MQIADDIHLFIGQAYGANSLVLLKRSDALLIDGMGSRADAAELKRIVEQDLGVRVNVVIQTHYFADHMAALGLFPEAEILAHVDYKETWESERFRSEEEATHFVEPTMLIHDRLTLRWGRHTLDVFHNPGHTPSTLNVDIPSADLLHVADTLVGNIVYLAYSDAERMAVAVERLRARGRSRVLASHGGIEDAVAIEKAAKYLEDLVNGSQPSAPLNDFEAIFHQRNLEQLAS
ncbi:MAG TPA: MBL fold metallo-hydrolase [Thermoanaerobaculia bacterium]|nr:MBL fold metallo-hydrolase [Thermoanaerobaculia bacterium]